MPFLRPAKKIATSQLNNLTVLLALSKFEVDTVSFSCIIFGATFSWTSTSRREEQKQKKRTAKNEMERDRVLTRGLYINVLRKIIRRSPLVVVKPAKQRKLTQVRLTIPNRDKQTISFDEELKILFLAGSVDVYETSHRILEVSLSELKLSLYNTCSSKLLCLHVNYFVYVVLQCDSQCCQQVKF